jgi:hypothetical protein
MTQMKSRAGTHTPEEGFTVDPVDNRLHTDVPDEPGALGGRPADDRALEVVEGGIGAVLGLAIGLTVAGPVGAIVGVIAGTLIALVLGEAFERRMGRVARTTNASDAAPFEPADATDVAEAAHEAAAH